MGRYKSLIKAITEAIQTGVGGNVSLNERSLLSHLVERKRGESFFAEEDKKWKPSERHETFVITRWLIRVITLLMTCLLWLFTVVCCLPIRLIKGVDLRHFRAKSLLNIKCSPVINLAAVAIVLVLGIVFIVNMITVGVKEVLFAPINLRVNGQGVITLEQPCLESHSFFLMNASTFWWPTDISVSDRDSVIISVSGSMYSDIGEVCSAATDNRHLRYNRMFFAPKNDSASFFDTFGTSICIKHDACFGALLCKVSNEHRDPSKTSNGQIREIGYRKNRFKAEQSGMLYITFNDVFLASETVDKLREVDLNTVVMKEELEGTEFFERLDSGRLKAGYEEIWFNDNVGEYLVNIRVKKDICHSNIPLYKKPIFIVYRGIEEHSMAYWIVWIVGVILLYVIVDCLVSNLLQRQRRLKQDGSKCHAKTNETASE